MQKKSPYDMIKSRYITEKAQVLETLKDKTSNPSLKKCQTPKYVFLVDSRANKQEIAQAVEEIYGASSIKVTSVNIVNMKPKLRRLRGRSGFTAALKKAIVSLEPGDLIEEKR